MGASVVELHTGIYASAQGVTQKNECKRIKAAAIYATSLGLVVNAGHGLHYENVSTIANLNIAVITKGDDPETSITQAPSSNSAFQTVTFTLFSPDDVEKIEWKLDGAGYVETPCTPPLSHCQVTVPGLQPYGRHRLEARAVKGVSKDSTPATVEWEIGHCNNQA